MAIRFTLTRILPAFALFLALLAGTLLVDTMKQWRRVHLPLTMVFLALALLHVTATLPFWRW